MDKRKPIEKRFVGYRKALGMTGCKPTMTINQVRALEGLPPIAATTPIT